MPSKPYKQIKRKRSGKPVEALSNSKVLHVARNTRLLCNVLADDDIWGGDTFPDVCDGLIVKLHPPAGISDEELDSIVQRFKKAGAAAVIKAPRAPSVALVPVKVQAVAQTTRDVVFGLVEATKFADKQALRDAVEAVLVEEGI